MLCALQWAESLYKELDYRREARNGIRFRELYGDLEVQLPGSAYCADHPSSSLHVLHTGLCMFIICGSHMRSCAMERNLWLVLTIQRWLVIEMHPWFYVQGIYAPEMLLEMTTPRVLIMEWIEGRRLRRAGKDGFGPTQAELQDDLKLVEIGVQCSLEQVCARLLQIYSVHANVAAELYSVRQSG